nr:hypothetical protein [Tanacetum cinerariifolium]
MKVIITEDSVRQALRLDDVYIIDCLPNEEIFAELVRMGLVRNVDSSSKFYMYPRFLQLMINDQVGDLSSHTTKYTSRALTQKVFANIRRVGKGFSGVDTLLFEGMLVPQQVHDDVVDDVADDVDDDKIAQAIKTTKLKQRVWKLEKKRKLKASGLKRLRKVRTAQRAKSSANTGRLEESQAQVYHLDLEHAQKVLSMQDDEAEPAKFKEVIKVATTAKLMTEVVTAAATTITVSLMPKASVARRRKGDDEAEPTKFKEVIKVVTTAKLMTEVVTAAATTITVSLMPKASAARRRKGVVIRDPEETATPSVIVHSEPKSKDKGKGILVEEPKPLKKQAQIE